ncbi:MAG: anhydro-N-acetylmuramic acid kinase [Chromatiaceae bacterium]|nr:anhydro-N-acetylmuramic acid kinase [Gammaproteobacteria bacterium]MCP5299940.1 anhydro-N-acetylmuramic acid kinase [Chromatiaceae bacterium]MCP5422014.1 anhydro-N-acetylmuramic acid kinase [Chromatiaceae bacterium]
MSGTSMDAVDIAAVSFDDAHPSLIAAAHHQWPTGLADRLRNFANGTALNATEVVLLDAATGAHIADAIADFMHRHGIAAADVAAIGCHGQTVTHAPDAHPGVTFQLGDANIIAERTGVTTVNDFRRRDLAAGGQGAPLAPAFHAATLRTAEETRVVLNLGGIANVTVLPADPGAQVIGFDTGPANCLMDHWAARHLGEPFDRGGQWAAAGNVDADLLARLHADPYFALQPPKSTGTQYFSTSWLEARLADRTTSAGDVQATLLAFTATTVADAVARHAPDAQRMLVCGGGVHNTALITRLNELLGLAVESTAAYGIDPDWMEAMAFAWLAMRTLAGRDGNLPSVTAAAGPRILGAVHPA